ncbi:glycosyltransferase family 2 protein [Selenomonas ruminantium]|uniref:Glycosyl transferase family 2 n=1 Tax=Selenomonas ruminantium TaxID=971 RepID=A0A1I0XW09_SELRU|nr:glycosyltransferase family 2 protein [Selenomonas ruminantium]SFB05181.1 Glycosyl transferase family 2 [Selenomonas ruminantium]
MYNPKFSIITVVYNSVETVEQTIMSVLTQSYDNVEYIVIDGGSTDGTVDIIKKYSDKLSYWVTEPDNGMYDALVKGFKHVTGDICAYINADDFYQQGAFETVKEIFADMSVKWLTGINTHYNMRGQIVGASVPYKYRQKFIRGGVYGKKLPFIQQESTFWRTELLKYVDMGKLRNYKLAGDFYLWNCFCEHADLYIISCILSGFRLRNGQLSSELNGYYKEMDEICKYHLGVLDTIKVFIDKLCWKIPYKLNGDIIRWDKESNSWTNANKEKKYGV